MSLQFEAYLVVQVNGKLRDQVEVPVDIDQDAILEIVTAREKLQPWLDGKQIVKFIYVPGKLANLVVK